MASVASAIGSYLRSKGAVVPQSDDISIDVLILNYGDGVQLGMVTDGKIASGPHRITRRFAPEFGKLVTAGPDAGMATRPAEYLSMASRFRTEFSSVSLLLQPPLLPPLSRPLLLQLWHPVALPLLPLVLLPLWSPLSPFWLSRCRH
jgi:hypothetical protein